MFSNLKVNKLIFLTTLAVSFVLGGTVLNKRYSSIALAADAKHGGGGYTKIQAFVEKFNTGQTNYVRSLATDENDLWVGTSQGVMQINRRTGALLNTYTRKDGLKNEYVFVISIDKDGTKWFGTNAGGMTRFDGKNWKTFVPMHGLADYWVYAIDYEKDGTMWIGTWAGVNRYDGKEFSTYSVPDGLINEWVYGISVDKDDVKWFGTEGGVTRYDGKTWKSWTHKDGLGAGNVKKLERSHNTALGTRDRHDLSVLNASGYGTYMTNYVFCSLVDQDDYKWFGTWGGGASRFDGKTFRNFIEEDGIAGNVVYDIKQAADGTLWFGTNKGVSKLENGKWESMKVGDGLIDDHVYTIAIDQDKNIWLGQRGGVVKLVLKKNIVIPSKPINLIP